MTRKSKERNAVEGGTAVFSQCERYRYALARLWDAQAPRLMVIMLNPSTATAEVNDPSVARCCYRARMLGFGSIKVGNLFAWRSTDPAAMKAVADPVGPDNNRHLIEMARLSDMVIAAWGVHGWHMNRSQDVQMLLAHHGINLHALKINDDGSPAHPLYLPYRLRPFAWNRA